MSSPFVRSASDPQVYDDSHRLICDLCRAHDIPLMGKSDHLPEAAFKIAIGWRWIIQDCPNLIVFHDSLLPKFRGFSPLVNALIKGEKRTGVTAFWASQQYDSGPIIDQISFALRYPVTISQALQQMSAAYEEMAVSIVGRIVSGQPLPSTAQEEQDATYSIWRDSEDYRVDWTETSAVIKRTIDALGHPYRGAYSLINGQKAILKSAEVYPEKTLEIRHIGKVLLMEGQDPVVICGSGLLRLTHIETLQGDRYFLQKSRSRFS